MKIMTRTLGAAIAAIAMFSGSTSETRAAEITLDGSGYYNLANRTGYHGGGMKQTGRYANLGADYYHKATISMEWITNRSSVRSGSISFELWAMPYYGATKGIVLMTRGGDSIRAGGYRFQKEWNGHAVFLDTYRYPELNLFEYIHNRWEWKDALSFKRKNLL